MKRQKNQIAMLTLLLSLMYQTMPSASAKVITVATNSDHILPLIVSSSPNNFQSVRTINCDMMDNPHGGKFWAVAIEGTNGSSATDAAAIYAEYNGAFFVNQSIPLPSSARDVDVVISDDMTSVGSAQGENYLITVVYFDASLSKIMTATYAASNIGTVSRSISTFPVKGPIALTGVGSYRYPHIDLFGDRTSSWWGTHKALHEFAAVWDEQVAPGVYQVNLTIGDITKANGMVPSVSTFAVTNATTDACHADVAAQTWLTPSGGPVNLVKTAWITYANSSNTQLGLTQVDFDNSITPIPYQTSTILQNGAYTINGIPRIESQCLADVIPNKATYIVAATDGPNPYLYMDGGIVRSIVNWGSSYSLVRPTVTGVGPNMISSPTNLGASHFTVMYETDNVFPGTSTSTGFYYSNCFDMVGEDENMSTLGTYRQINKNPMTVTPANSACAIANSSNSGDDILAVWYAGIISGKGVLNYKFGGNTYAYKTTIVPSVTTKDIFDIFPNPTSDILHIECPDNTKYSITDMLGNVVGNGAINNNGSINAGRLANGSYILKLASGENVKTIKFVKS